jgi:hypothetical protein
MVPLLARERSPTATDLRVRESGYMLLPAEGKGQP